jgi:hypothetical protein
MRKYKVNEAEMQKAEKVKMEY